MRDVTAGPAYCLDLWPLPPPPETARDGESGRLPGQLPTLAVGLVGVGVMVLLLAMVMVFVVN